MNITLPKTLGAPTAHASLLVLLVLVIAAMMAPSVLAREIETTAVGYGADENTALADALAKAIAQVNGVSASLDVSTGKDVIMTEGTTSKGGETTEEHAKLEAGRTADARMRASGSVSRYEVLNNEQVDGGRTKLTVRAFIGRVDAPTYTAPGSSVGKKRLAILPAAANAPGYDFFGGVGGAELAGSLTSEVESAALRSGAVSVLDRTTLQASLAEIGIVASTLTGSLEKAKLRQFRGADLIVMLTIGDARYAEHYWSIKSTGQTKSAVEMNFSVDVRAVSPATGELILSERVQISDAGSRAEALGRSAEAAAGIVVSALTGRRMPTATSAYRAPSEGAVLAPQPEPPREQRGVVLPIDR